MSRSFLFRGLLALFFALQIGGCGESPVGPEGEGLWPMAVGNRWIGVWEYFNFFGESLGTDPVRDTILITGTVDINGERWYRFGNEALQTNREDGVWTRSSESAKAEYLIARYPAARGDTFGSLIFPEIDISGPTGDTFVFWTGTLAIDSAITVPAGTFACHVYGDFMQMQGPGFPVFGPELGIFACAPGTGPVLWRMTDPAMSFRGSDTLYYEWKLEKADRIR